MPEFPINRLSTLTLGTVQIGIPYGKVERSEPQPEHVASTILDSAWKGGIRCLDTARNYGLSEQRIGKWLKDTSKNPLIISKLPAFKADEFPDGETFVKEQLKASLSMLGVNMLDGYLVHRPSDTQVPGLIDAILAELSNEKIRAWGVSVYSPDEFEAALNLPEISLIQAPVSIFDTRIASAGLISKAASQGVMIFARSIFLQGAAFIDPESPPPALVDLVPAVRQLNALAQDASIPVGALALNSVLTLDGVRSAVVGVNSEEQLLEILSWAEFKIDDTTLANALQIGDALQSDVIDPRTWPQPVS